LQGEFRAVMALVFQSTAQAADLDMLKVLKMLLIHDIVEIDAGDNFVFDAAAMDSLQPLLNHLLTANEGENPRRLRASDIRAWKAHIADSSESLWQLALELLDQSVDRGLYLSD
jgi:hypothetical protein